MLISVLITSAILSGCKKLVDVNPPTNALTVENVFEADATAASVMTGMYSSLSNSDGVANGLNGISMIAGLSSDELTLWEGNLDITLQRFYQNALTSQQAPNYWVMFYRFINTANSTIEGLNKSIVLTPAVKNQLLGEAKFMRAFFHFYLVNFYGDASLVTSSDWRINAAIGRTSKEDIYQLIIADLMEAQSLLSDKYLKSDALTPYATGGEERVRPTKWAATALLARVYLYTGDWVNAEVQSSALLENTSLYTLSTLEDAFKKNSVEAIWQLPPVNYNRNTEDGFRFIITSNPSSNRPALLSSFLLSAFDTNDLRRTYWVGNTDNWYFPYKYKVRASEEVTEYLMVLRLAEQYLIRAEARAEQDNISGAQNDVNVIRLRAGLDSTTAADKTALLDAISHERRIEFFTEWGHRWFDLKRTGRIDAVMGAGGVCAAKGGTWNSNWQLFPLSFTDIQLNPNLAPNNPGY